MITGICCKCSVLGNKLQWIWDNNLHFWRAINFQCYWLSYRFPSNCSYRKSPNEWSSLIGFDLHCSAHNTGATGRASGLSHLTRRWREFIRIYTATYDTSWERTDDVCLVTGTCIKCSFLCNWLQWVWDNNWHRWRAINFQCNWLSNLSSSRSFNCESSNEWSTFIGFHCHGSACDIGVSRAAALSHLTRRRSKMIRSYWASRNSSWELFDDIGLITRTYRPCSFLRCSLQWIWHINFHAWRTFYLQCNWLSYLCSSFSYNYERPNEWPRHISFDRHRSTCNIGVSKAAALSHLSRRSSKMIRSYWASRISSWELFDDIGLITRTDRPCSFLRRSLQWIWHINLYTRSTLKTFHLPGINTWFWYIRTYSTVIVTCSTTPRIVFARTKSMTRLWTFT